MFKWKWFTGSLIATKARHWKLHIRKDLYTELKHLVQNASPANSVCSVKYSSLKKARFT